MKTCPVCKARCFDDMEICYGCMHHFEDVGSTSGTVTATDSDALQQTAVFCSVADPFDEKEEVSTRHAAAEVVKPTSALRLEGDTSCAADLCSESTAFSLEELFAGKEYRLEIRLYSCKKE